jgi:hypothetical protein
MIRLHNDEHEMGRLVEVSDRPLEAACSALLQKFPAEDATRDNRGAWEHRNSYDGNGEYELPRARHYVPDYWRS